ncbi:MAG: energy-coupling factor transporter ATPase [Eubacteriales bacterium SKADARSKE-1]|nr:energy-coupling factor transporter ATPase [Eubacteriales bacterium SKADARSKE-1]
MPILEVKNLSFIYGVGTTFQKTAVDNINLSFEKGEFIGIIGHTGSGKSTFIKQLNGLLRPSSGEVLLNGENIWRNSKKIRDVRFKVGMVFQYPEYQLFADTVYKDIAFGPENMGLNSEEINKKVLAAVDFVGLSHEILEKSPFEISGGEKRRTAIAGVIAMDPEVLILDEPTAGLDPRGRELLLSQIKTYHSKRKNTVILVSHNMEDIAKTADKVVVLANGKAEMFDITREVFKNSESLERVGLKVPQITEIMEKLKNKGYDINPGILTVTEAENEILRILGEWGKC